MCFIGIVVFFIIFFRLVYFIYMKDIVESQRITMDYRIKIDRIIRKNFYESIETKEKVKLLPYSNENKKIIKNN